MAKLGLLLLTFILLVAFCSSMAISKRAVRGYNRSSGVDICRPGNPCGWTVYQPISRRPEHFIPNRCQCPSGTTCTRVEDDVAISAYVSRCISPTASNDLNF